MDKRIPKWQETRKTCTAWTQRKTQCINYALKHCNIHHVTSLHRRNNVYAKVLHMRRDRGTYLTFCIQAIIIVNYHIVHHQHQTGWLLMFLIVLHYIIVQPYKKTYLNVFDSLLLALLGFLTLRYSCISCHQQMELRHSSSYLWLAIPVVCHSLSCCWASSADNWKECGLCNNHIAGKIGTLLTEKVHTRIQAGDNLSNADSLPHWLVSPNQYNRSLLSEFEQEHVSSETLAIREQIQPVYTYGSISWIALCFLELCS